MQRKKLAVQKLPNFQGELPAYQTLYASGFDIRAQLKKPVQLAPGDRMLVPTGLAFAIPEGFELQVRPRSGLAIKNGISLVNSPGTIDADYRGEVKVIVINHGRETFTIQDQDRIAQLILCPVLQADLELVDSLPETVRGTGGFGSTGVHTENAIL